MATRDLRVNRQIRAREVLVIDEDGNQKGIMSSFDAIELAEQAGLDLVEVSPNANPLYAKFSIMVSSATSKEKRLRDQKRNQVITKMKEIRMQPKIEQHDLNTRANSSETSSPKVTK